MGKERSSDSSGLLSLAYDRIAKDTYCVQDALNYLKPLQSTSISDIKPDIWVHNPGPKDIKDFSYKPRVLREKKPQEMTNWLALAPGDIIYYQGAFGFKAAVHWGVYVGNGYVLEKWRGLHNPKMGDVVLSSLAMFGTEKNMVLSWDSRQFLKGLFMIWKGLHQLFKKENNYYRRIYLAVNSRVHPTNIIKHLPRVGKKESYHLLTNSCSHFVMDIAFDYKSNNMWTSFIETIDLFFQKSL